MAHCAGEKWPNAKLSQALTFPFKLYRSQFYNWLNCTIMTSSFLLCKVFMGETEWHQWRYAWVLLWLLHCIAAVFSICWVYRWVFYRFNPCCSLLFIEQFSQCKRFNFDRWNDAVTNRPPHVGLITVSNHHCCIDDPGLLGINIATWQYICIVCILSHELTNKSEPYCNYCFLRLHSIALLWSCLSSASSPV